jgi:hypothetical protein
MRLGRIQLFEPDGNVRILFQYAKMGRVIRLVTRVERRPHRLFFYKPLVDWRSWKHWNVHLAFGFGFVAFGLIWDRHA